MTLDRFLLIIQNDSAGKNKTQTIGIKIELGFFSRGGRTRCFMYNVCALTLCCFHSGSTQTFVDFVEGADSTTLTGVILVDRCMEIRSGPSVA